MNDLPRVFANKIDKDINKSQNIYYGSNRNIVKKDINIFKKINDIFNDSHYVYKSRVLITFSDTKEEKIVVGRNKDNLITMEGELINISKIIDIEKI